MTHLGRTASLAFAVLALAASRPAAAAPLGSGLAQLTQAWENGDTVRLATGLDVHLASNYGDPLVGVVLGEGVPASEVLPHLSAMGFQVTAVSKLDARRLEGFMPFYAVRAAAGVPGLASLHAVKRPLRNAGAVQNQAVALHKADLAQARGLDGKGIKIGVLSDSYDTCTSCDTHAADDVASGDLPAAGVTVLLDQPGGSDEGRGMLQLVHDVAPASALAFATAWTGQVGFANNILALRESFGADVIVDDVIYFEEPMYSDGVIAQAVDAVAGSGGAYFSSAGNNGIQAFEAEYEGVPFAKAKARLAAAGSNVKLDQIPAAIRPKSIHDFGRGLTQRFTTAAENVMALQWDEPFYMGLVKTDFNVYVFDADGNWMDPFAATFPGFYTYDDNVEVDSPFEYVVLPPFPGEVHGGANVSDYQIVIGNVNGGPAKHFKYVNVNGLGESQRQGASAIWGHAAARGGQAVAAAYYAIPGFPEDFSAGGPTTIYVDSATGKRLRRPEVRATPQITAADGCDTTFFGFDSDGNGLPNFFGTSAAAPNAAALAALTLQAAGGPGSLAPARLYRLLQRTASPIWLANDRTWAGALAGPVVFDATGGDWTRWGQYFGLSMLPFTRRTVASVSIDVSAADLTFSANPARFHVGESKGVAPTDITGARSPDGTVYTMTFAQGSFRAGESFRFGHSVYNPLQGSTQELPDRFRDATVTVTLDNGLAFTSKVFAAPKVPFSRYTGAGLIDVDFATKVAERR